MKSNITYEDFQKYLRSGKAEYVDAVKSYFVQFIMPHAESLYKRSEGHLGSNNESEDAFQNMVIACLQDLATQTSGGKPKFEYRGNSETELLGYVKLRLGASFSNDTGRSTEHSKIRRQQRQHDNLDDHIHAESVDIPIEEYVDLEKFLKHFIETLQKVNKLDHKLGLILNYGLHDFKGNFSPDSVAHLAESLGGKKHFVSSIRKQTQSLLNLTSDLKLDPKQIAHIIDTSPGNFRRIDRDFQDVVRNID